MARKRDYKAEYARRLQRGLKKGLSRSQARGHARAKESAVRQRKAKAGEVKKIERAVKALRSGKSQKAAAKTGGISVERLRRFIYENKLATRQGSRWVMTDDRPRRVPTIYKGQFRTVIVPGFAGASLAGQYHNAVGHFVRSNDLSVIEPFEGEGLTDVKGRFFEFETDPNALHRYAAMDTPAFHEIYQIVSN